MLIGTGILTINWSSYETSSHYVQKPKPFKSVPSYGEAWKSKDFIVYAAYTGYYRFYNDGRVTLDDGVKIKKRPGISFQYESTDVIQNNAE